MTKKMILLVEDDTVMAELYQTILSGSFEVVIAENGLVALEKVSSVKPDLILLDIMMPQMNGFEVLDNLKANVSTKNIPVVMLSNMAGENEKKIAKDKGAIQYIVKSDIDPSELVIIISELLNKSPNPSIVS